MPMTTLGEEYQLYIEATDHKQDPTVQAVERLTTQMMGCSVQNVEVVRMDWEFGDVELQAVKVEQTHVIFSCKFC